MLQGYKEVFCEHAPTIRFFVWHFFPKLGKNRPKNCCWKFFSKFGKNRKIPKNFQKNIFGNFENKIAKFGKIQKLTWFSKFGKKHNFVKIGIFFPNLEKNYQLFGYLLKKVGIFFPNLAKKLPIVIFVKIIKVGSFFPNLEKKTSKFYN